MWGGVQVAESVTRFSMHAVLCRVLTGGTTTCDVFSGADYYGKLAVVRAAACRDFFCYTVYMQTTAK